MKEAPQDVEIAVTDTSVPDKAPAVEEAPSAKAVVSPNTNRQANSKNNRYYETTICLWYTIVKCVFK